MKRSRVLRNTSILSGIFAAGLVLAGAAPARADEHLVRVDTIDVLGAGLGAFDISFVDSKLDLYVLSDRTNASVDFFDASDDTFTGRVGGFAGVAHNPDGTVNNDLSGPDGVLVVGPNEVWAGDGPQNGGTSSVKVIDIATFQVDFTIDTGGKARSDEMAYDPRDHLVIVANDADNPPYVSLIDTQTHSVVGTIPFDGNNGAPTATAGLEQPQWSPTTGLFYISVPATDTTAVDPTQANGAISVIDPHGMKVVANFPVVNCSPAGLAIGPNNQALIGCSGAFGTPARTQSLVIGLSDGNVVATFPQVGGSDEVWFDPGSQHYYLAARSNTNANGVLTPVIGTIDAQTNAFDGNIRTSTSAHSVAADRVSKHIFVPIAFPATGATDAHNPCPNVSRGCVAVYLPSSLDDDDVGTRVAGR